MQRQRDDSGYEGGLTHPSPGGLAAIGFAAAEQPAHHARDPERPREQHG
ncbi:MAG: hypothetical protein ACR2J6_04800 [Thermoleophilaceae bacterium]